MVRFGKQTNFALYGAPRIQPNEAFVKVDALAGVALLDYRFPEEF